MRTYIKINNEYKEVKNIYKKINDIWTLQDNDIISVLENCLYFYDSTDIGQGNSTIEIDPDTGNTTTTTTNVTENNDGTTTTNIDVVITDSSGNVINSSSTEKITNEDGSSSSVTTNYDANGNETGHVNENIDTSGNIKTQTVEKDSNGNDVVTGYVIDTSNNENGGIDLGGNSGIDTGVNAFDGSDFEIYLKAKINANNNKSASSAPIINIRKDERSNLYGFTLSTTYSSSAQIMSNSSSGGLRMSAVIYTGSSSISKWERMTEKIGNYYYYFGIRNSDNDTIYIYRIIKNGNTIICRIYNENDTELIGVARDSSTSDEYTFTTSAEYSDVTIEVGHSTSRQGTDQYCNLEILDLKVQKII